MAEALPEPAERGKLTISPRVVERVATMAAREVDGVVPVTSTLDRLASRSLPKADAHLAGQRTRIQMSIAAAWPKPLPEVAAAVRDRVSERVASLVSLTVDGVSVEVSSVVHAESDERRVQ
ncbi:hypothetical protein BH18ACT9_BH18ACT9_00180 [soil metagenome]